MPSKKLKAAEAQSTSKLRKIFLVVLPTFVLSSLILLFLTGQCRPGQPRALYTAVEGTNSSDSVDLIATPLSLRFMIHVYRQLLLNGVAGYTTVGDEL
jgi:hypothetical protein